MSPSHTGAVLLEYVSPLPAPGELPQVLKKLAFERFRNTTRTMFRRLFDVEL